MRKLMLMAIVLSSPALADQVRVKGHVRSDGTYVPAHTRTAPNATKLDNYSTEGNYNPSTGRVGTVDPYKPTQANPTGSPYNKPEKAKSPYGY
jgi:hypothetical protein